MIRTLHVYLHDRYVGRLSQREDGLQEFTYAPAYLSSPDAVVLSQSLPLREETFRNTECKGFFAGILPEGQVRIQVAGNLGVSPGNDFSLLDRIGGECAGAVTFLPPGQELQEESHRYRLLSAQDMETVLQELSHHPLLAGSDGIRLSLAGAQNKLALHISGDQLSLPLDNAPSTHILKPGAAGFEGIVENEAFCMTLARRLGLEVADVQIRSVGQKKFLLVERYDRIFSGIPERPLLRLHQEDFCQALGVIPEKKYEEEGGVSVRQCFDLIRTVCSVPLVDIRKMLDAVIYNFVIGNCDAHGKNFSLLYDRGTVRLAPLYDLVCTGVYPQLSGNMAMKIGGKYKSASIEPAHFEHMAKETGLSWPLVRRRVGEIARAVSGLLEEGTDPFTEAASGVVAWIRRHADRIAEQY